jgi:hypothetical protein
MIKTKLDLQDNNLYDLLLDGLTVTVRLLDEKHVFGRVDVLVTPLSGSGEKWTRQDKLMEKEGGE